MPAFVSLLRAVNVGGNGLVRMADLATLYESLGFASVKTVLQSGNVVFTTKRSEVKGLAARIAAASGLYAEVLRWTEAVRDHVDGEAEPALLSLRADALAAAGDHAAIPAYRKAVAAASPDQAAGLRTRLARAAVLSGDLASAEEALAGLEPNGGPDDGAILLVRGMLAYFSGDIDGADAALFTLT